MFLDKSKSENFGIDLDFLLMDIFFFFLILLCKIINVLIVWVFEVIVYVVLVVYLFVYIVNCGIIIVIF